MRNSHHWALGLRALAVAVPVLACCCPALPMASQQTDELLQITCEADSKDTQAQDTAVTPCTLKPAQQELTTSQAQLDQSPTPL